LRIGALVRDVVIDGRRCVVEAPGGRPDAELSTSPATWLEIDAGQLSGVEAFADKRLTLRGSIQKSLLFEPLFDRPADGALQYSVERVPIGKVEISTVIAGSEDAPPLLLLHGLGATNGSWMPVVPHLARHYRVFAVDLPGSGSSSKPRGRYDAPWFAERMFEFMDSIGYRAMSVAGNSMGGRIAQEMAMRRPDCVTALACLCPATAFAQRPGLLAARVLRPELGIAVGFLPRERVKAGMKDLFARSARVEESWFDAAIDDFLRTWKSPRARMAFFAAARNIYLDEPYGGRGFWTRLCEMEPPALYIFGRQDILISYRFAAKVQRSLPAAHVQLWNDCGHVPQIEHPQKTVQELLTFFGQATKENLAAAN